MTGRILTCSALALLIACRPDAAGAQEAPASGKDITRPLQRVDLRTEVADEGEEDVVTVTLRHDRPVELGDGWRLNLRADLPFKFVDRPETEAPGAVSGFGDVLVQAILVHRADERRAFGFGVQVRAPTSDRDVSSRNQWQLLPTVGHRWSLPGISEESFFQAVARYRFSFGGSDDTPTISELQLSPNLEIGLPDRAYLSIFPSSDIHYDFRTDSVFLPVNLEVGKEWGRVVASLEGAVAMIDGKSAPYDWKLEARIGFRF